MYRRITEIETPSQDVDWDRASTSIGEMPDRSDISIVLRGFPLGCLASNRTRIGGYRSSCEKKSFIVNFRFQNMRLSLRCLLLKQGKGLVTSQDSGPRGLCPKLV